MGSGRANGADRAQSVTLIRAGHVVPVRPRGRVCEDHAVAIADDRILALLPWNEARARWPAADVVALPDHVLLPGLVNSHTHAPMTLLRGYADDMELHHWLQEHIWPAERDHVGPEFVRDGTLLAIAEMFRNGTTCFNDMYYFPAATIEACLAAGMRASIGMIVIEIETAGGRDVEDYLDRGLHLREEFSAEPLLSFTLAPHAPYTVSDETLRRIAELSGAQCIPVHMHVLETEWEIKQSFQQHDCHPLARLERQGLLGPLLQAVHMVQLSGQDIDTIAEAGINVVHCPQSNLKLASGFCPLQVLQQAGVNVSLGTDGAASNNDLDLLAEAQTAALLGKGVSGDAKAVDAFAAIEMLTINGARALGLDDRIGSIEAGKQADLVALDLRAPETQPLHHVISQVVYAASARQVSDVWVAGRRVLEEGRLTTIDLDALLEQAEHWRRRLSSHRDSADSRERPAAS